MECREMRGSGAIGQDYRTRRRDGAVTPALQDRFFPTTGALAH